MTNLWKTKLLQAAALTFEDLCFLLPDEELTEAQQHASLDAAVQVEFCGPFHGVLVLRLSNTLLPSIAANMLGEVEIPSPEEQDDALGEIANVICGNVLPEIAGGRAIFQLSAPKRIEPSERPPVDGVSRRADVCFGVDQGRAEIALFAAPDAGSFIEESRA